MPECIICGSESDSVTYSPRPIFDDSQGKACVDCYLFLVLRAKYFWDQGQLCAVRLEINKSKPFRG